MPIRFRPPRDVPDLGLNPGQQARFNAWLRAAFVEIGEDLADLAFVDAPTKVEQETIDVPEGALRRVTPPATGMAIRIPAPSPTNVGAKIRILIEAPVGALTIVCRPGVGDDGKVFQPTINGQATATFTTSGLVELTSNGANDWKTTTEMPIESAAITPSSILSLISTMSINVSAGTIAQDLTAITFSNSNGVSFGLNDSVLTASIATSLTNIRISAGTTSVLGSAFTFSNSNNVSFGISTNGIITASATVVSTQASIRVSAGTTSVLSSAFTFSNSNNVSFGINAAGVVTASATVASTQASIRVSAGTTSVLSSAFTFSNLNNVSFGIDAAGVVTASATVASTQASIRISAGTTSALSSAFTFSNSNNVSFGINAAGVVTASASVATSLSAINVSAGTTSNNLSALTFSNLNGVSFGLNGSVLTASVGAGGAAGSISAGTTNVALGQVVFSNSNGLSFGLNGSTVTGSFSTLSFSNANNVTFGIAGSALTASVTVASTQASILVSAGTTSALSSSFRFSNANGMNFGISTNGIITARADSGISAVGAGTLSLNAAATGLQFQDSNGVSFNLSTNAGTPGNAFVFASVNPDIGLVSHVGGNSVASVTRLAFSNASNVTFSLSTAAGAATLLASVAAGGGGGIALAIPGSTYTSGTVSFSNDPNVSAILSATSNFGRTNVGFYTSTNSAVVAVAGFQVADNGAGGRFVSKIEFKNSNGIAFGEQSSTDTGGRIAVITGSFLAANDTFVTAAATLESVANVFFNTSGSSIAATAVIGFRAAGTDSTGTNNAHRVTQLQFIDGNGISFGLATNTVAQGRQAVLTASYNPLLSALSVNVGGLVAGSVGSVTNVRFDGAGAIVLNQTTAANALTLQISADDRAYAAPWHRLMAVQPGEGTVNLGFSFLHNRPIFFQLQPQDLEGTQVVPAASARSTLGPGRWMLLVSGQNTASTGVFGSSHPMTIRIGIYEMVNSTQISLVNSASIVNTATSNGASAVSMYGGVRWGEIPAASWSNSTLSLREGLWAAVMVSTGATFETHMNMIGLTRGTVLQRGNNALFGQAGVSSLASAQLFPFEGYFSTTTGALPVSAGTTNASPFDGSSANLNFYPVLYRAGNARIAQV